MNLYNLTQQDADLYALLSGDDEIPDDQLYAILQSSEDAIHVKAARVIAMIKSFDADENELGEIARGYAARCNKAGKNATRLRDYLLLCMESASLEKVGTLEHCAKIPKPRASLQLDSYCDVPEQYKTIKEMTIIDKKTLKDDILSGSLSLVGAEIIYKKTLRIE